MARSIIIGDLPTGELPVNSQNPYWILVTFAYRINDTFDRGRMSSPPESGFRVVSRDDDQKQSRTTMPILFDQEIRGFQLTQGKNQHNHSLSLQMVNGDGNLRLLEYLNAGDWCLFWTFNSRRDYEKIRRRLVKSHGCTPWSGEFGNDDTGDKETVVTDWRSGLKFIGRLDSPEHTEYATGDGNIDVGYTLQAFAFTELENIIYYDGLIHFKYPDALQFYQDLGIGLNTFLELNDGPRKGFVNTTLAIPGLVQILLGKGPGVLTKDKGALSSTVDRARLQDSPNVQFEVPERVVKMLRGITSQVRYYSDVLLQYIGDQSYDDIVKATDFKNLIPDEEAMTDDTVLYARGQLADYFAPEPQDFKEKSVWSIIQHFVNEPINEMYTALRPHPKTGMLLPTLVVRRNPYGSDTYQSKDDALKAMPFSALPRWIVPDSLCRGIRLRKSDSARINYVHLTPTIMPSQNPDVNETLVRLQAPPVVNRVDIQRHGLRPYITRINGFLNPIAEKDSSVGRQYTEFMADIVMDAHLRYNGTLTTVGIQEPISHGDNLVYNNMLFHIEGISHQGGIAPDGSKFFDSSLQLSHGIPLKTLEADRSDASANKKQQITDSGRNLNHDGLVDSGRNLNYDGIVDTGRDLGTTTEASKGESEVTDELQGIRDAIDRYQEPPEDGIRKLRNDRKELDLTGLIKARVHSEGSK